jgi:hypothetical protein
VKIQIILDEGTIKKILRRSNCLSWEIPNEQNQIKTKGVEERQKIIDSQVDSLPKDLYFKKFKVKILNYNALEAENIKFKSDNWRSKQYKGATEEHEREILAIKNLYAKKSIT